MESSMVITNKWEFEIVTLKSNVKSSSVSCKMSRSFSVYVVNDYFLFYDFFEEYIV